VRSAGVLGDVAADGAGALARGVGRIEEAAVLDGERDVEVHNAGLDDCPLVLVIELEDAIHAREGDHNSALAWDRTAGEAGAGAPAYERDAEFLRDAHDADDVLGRAREDDEIRAVLVDAAVVFV
jgi:hypothetical protein